MRAMQASNIIDQRQADPGAWDIEMAFDGVHYSEEGHRVFALRMQDTLESISSHTMP